ncbi:hypothetical protein [Mesorhizobium sp.]|uniref:hypothetical protein n=1 Tax=Mesorhizobium sp. TaxID=1871066 RepID=UPI000FE75D0D|nr:hypothetical protein [Mesorhizobium sp.]RWE86951.1 MAG: hypothetical protein EOS49_11855 [Mesorhizobium sp.]
MFEPQNVPPGMSAAEWHTRQLADRAVKKQIARLDAIDARKEEEASLRRRTAVTFVVSPLKGLAYAAVAKLRGTPDDNNGGVGWWN